MIALWDHQGRAVPQVLARCGEKATLLVAPTGAGKTVMGGAIVEALPGRTAWITHTKDLVQQSAAKLRELGMRVGIIAAGQPTDPFATVQVVSIQTAVARDLELNVENLFLDEAHHFMAEDWRAALGRFHAKRTLGATATPERRDGKPLGDIFSELVVAASYSELIGKGYLVPARVFRPARELRKGNALKPIEAYTKHALPESRRGFVYCRSVKEAAALAELMCVQFGDVCHAALVEAKTEDADRALRIAGLRDGTVSVLTNVYALTEGVDVPSADLAIFATWFGHASRMLQAAGRVLRAAPGKTDAMILDLAGSTHVHGLPTEDREYSLSGQGIRRTEAGRSIRVCMFCGMTFVGSGSCPRCGQANPVKPAKQIRIYNEELREVFAGHFTPQWAKENELKRMIAAHLTLPQIRKRYRELFDEDPDIAAVSGVDKQREYYDRLVADARGKGHRLGRAAHIFRARFGKFPPKEWEMEA